MDLEVILASKIHKGGYVDFSKKRQKITPTLNFFRFQMQNESFFSRGRRIFLQRSKMRFSIKVSGSDKMFFHVFPPAERATGLHRQIIQTVLQKENTFYQRKSDGQLFAIRKEDPILVAKIEGEDFFSLEEIQEKFGVSPTKFLNQVQNGKFMKKIDWISPELFPEKEKNLLTEMQEKIERLSSRVEKLEKAFSIGKN